LSALRTKTQYSARGAFPADVLIRECSKLSDVECEKKFPRPSFRLEDYADDFMLKFFLVFFFGKIIVQTKPSG
jgi:hypothetical protein